jgi:uncharacterized protein YjbI with pentapeptide repeats
MRKSHLSFSNFQKATLEWADLSENKFYRVNFDRANIQCATLEGSEISECRLTKTDFSWSNLKDTRFIKSDLQGANFCHSDLEGTRFEDCKLRGALFNMNTRLPFSIEMAKSLGMQMVQLKIFDTIH